MPQLFTKRIYHLPLMALVALALFTSSAQADNVTRLMGKLSKSSDNKVRLSAALSLAKLKDQRSVWTFVQALKDSDKTVRGVSAASLGKIVSSSTSSKMRARVLKELDKAISSDSNAFVRKQAKRALKLVKAIEDGGSVGSGNTYVNIGVMSAKVPDGKTMRAYMQKTVLKTFKKKATSMFTQWPGAANPSKKQISSKKVKAFHVDGTLLELKAVSSGSSTTVTCKVSMLLASYPEKSMFGFLKGGAQVQSSSSSKQIQYAKEDCVAAVMEDLVSRKIIPTLKARK